MNRRGASRRSTRPVPILFAALTACSVALSWLAHERDRLPGDLWLARRIQDLPGAVETPADALRAITSTETVLVLGALVVVAIVLARRWTLAIYSAATLALLPLLQSGLKDLVDRPRPDPALIAMRDTYTSTSFPSGHVMSGTVLLALVALAGWSFVSRERARRLIVGACVLLAALNGLANVYIGVHWPSDVLGGYLWAGVLLVGASCIVAAVRRTA